ncbi:MAG: hypothetical protein AAGH15_18855 [Myxococcota bacterium]
MARAALLLAFCVACGGGGALPPEPTLPDTGGDPITHLPASAASGPAGRPLGLALSGGHEQALGLLRRLFEAVRDGDRMHLRRLLAERTAQVQPRMTALLVPRENRVRMLLDQRRPSGRRLAPGALPEEHLRFEDATVQPLSTVELLNGLPRGLRPSDLLVSVPVQPGQGALLRRVFQGWDHRGQIIVRTGAEPVILGL